jgi:hypothetical protein
MAYKIVEFDGKYSILKNDSVSIPRSSGNSDYMMFLEDIALGNDTVEGPDVVAPSYAELRIAAYPDIADQLDMQYWDGVNGTTTWADRIQAIKDAHPTSITGGTTIGDVPTWVQEESDAWLANDQLVKYTNAVERLSQYILADGRTEVTEEVVIGSEYALDENGEMILEESDGADPSYVMQDITRTRILATAIDPVEPTITRAVYPDDSTEEITEETIENPVITKDNAERTEAQAIVDATPQAVIDTYNGE